MNELFWLTILLFVIAAVLRSELFFYLLYVVVGLQLVVRFWIRQSARNLTWRRRMPKAAFPGEPLEVELELTNTSLLPLPWLSFSESLPTALHNPPSIQKVVSLGAQEQRIIRYTLAGQQRGFYQIGPLTLRTGDVLGLTERTLQGPDNDYLTIYPTVLSLDELGLPASLPYGTLAAQQRLFYDPARPVGVRPYRATDGVRRIDWKASARLGAPHVRRYQPAIALESLIALAFSRDEYQGRYIYDTMERALVAAASVASHLVGLGQPVGFCTNGRDPASGAIASPISVAAGRSHLLAMLEMLGRLEAGDDEPLSEVLFRTSAHLGWGSTVVVITGQRGVDLVAALLPLKQRGLNVALIMTDPLPDDLGLPRRHGIMTMGLWRDGRPSFV
ncbi:MAG: DUF58 domain-containing protein [Chloroflexota bacterium]